VNFNNSDYQTTKKLEIKKQGYITDRDGNKYDTIHYKGYAIMIENLQTKTFANGDKIEQIKSNKDWKENNKKKESGWCYYNNQKSYKKEHGILYTAATISDLRELAPEGWHIPSSQEWKKIIGGFYNKRPNRSMDCELKTKFIEDVVKEKKNNADRGQIQTVKLNFTGYGFRDYRGNFKGETVHDGKAAYLFLSDSKYMIVGWLATDIKDYDFADKFSGNFGAYVRCIKKLD
jgi:uncharacterized protein (TIGR02145 family)